jgi:hypothetical protein
MKGELRKGLKARKIRKLSAQNFSAEAGFSRKSFY